MKVATKIIQVAQSNLLCHFSIQYGTALRLSTRAQIITFGVKGSKQRNLPRHLTEAAGRPT